MPKLTKRDRFEILALRPLFRRDLSRLNELRRRPPLVTEIFSKTPRVRQKANQEEAERKAIEGRMYAVGLPAPPAPAMFANGWKRDDGSPVRPHMRVTKTNTSHSLAKRKDGKEVISRVSESTIKYDLRNNQVLTVDIDITATIPRQLSKLVHEHIKKARKQLGFIRDRVPLADDWNTWKEHRIKGKSQTQIARERTGIITEDARKNNTLNACIMSIQRSVNRIDQKIKLLPYPPRRY